MTVFDRSSVYIGCFCVIFLLACSAFGAADLSSEALGDSITELAGNDLDYQSAAEKDGKVALDAERLDDVGINEDIKESHDIDDDTSPAALEDMEDMDAEGGG